MTHDFSDGDEYRIPYQYDKYLPKVVELQYLNLPVYKQEHTQHNNNIMSTNYESIPPFIIKATITASLGGILFGYDMGVISAALPQLTNTFDLRQGQQEMVVSFLYIGCCIGAIFGGVLCDVHGRKRMIMCTDFLFVIGAAVLYLATTFIRVLVGRILIGVAVAISGIADVAYLHEISPLQFRGSIVSCNEACISLGFMMSYLIGYGISVYIPNDGWRYMFGLGSLIAILQFVGMLFMPESPVWLKEKGQLQAADAALLQIYGSRSNLEEAETRDTQRTRTSSNKASSRRLVEPDQNQSTLESYSSFNIEQSLEQENHDAEEFSSRTVRKYYRQITIALFLSIMQQFCGHPNVLNFAPEIFAQIGFDSEEGRLISTSLIGVVSTILHSGQVLDINAEQKYSHRPPPKGQVCNCLLCYL